VKTLPSEFAVFTTINNLKPGTEGHFIVVRVMDVIQVVDKKRCDGTKIRVALCTVGDETASVVFIAKDNQIDIMTQGACVQLLNAKVIMFEGFMRLEVDKWGKVMPSKRIIDPKSVQSRNMSTVEYELVEKQEELSDQTQ